MKCSTKFCGNNDIEIIYLGLPLCKNCWSEKCKDD